MSTPTGAQADAAPGLTVHDAPGHCTVTLARADKANALTAAMMDALAASVSHASAQRPLVLCSASPRVFCAGADIGEFAGGAQRLAGQEAALLRLIEAMSATPAPIVVLARGRASGAGLLLLCLADVVIAADDLAAGAPEIVFGMYPVIVEAVLRSRLSPAASAALCFSGRTLDAVQARDAGLVTDIVPTAGFEAAAADRLAFHLARGSALAIARRARLSGPEPAALRERLSRVAPMMGENYADPAVRQRIDGYLAQLARPDRASR